MKKELILGQKIRHNQLRKWRKDIPSIKEIIKKDYIYFEKWFLKYEKLINFGCRQIIKKEANGNKLKLIYSNYSKSEKKIFTNYFPLKIKVDKDFQYFFGLWCGDRLGSGRFGVGNKNKEINLYTKYYLKKLYQKPEFILTYNQGIKKPKLDYKIDKYYINKAETNIRGYCISVGIKNGIMFTFFDYLYKNLDKILTYFPNPYIFFAGLFDAEGNVFLEDSCFRWACLDKEKVSIYKKHLKKLNLFKRYDGCNLVTYNKNTFSKEILPHIKHPDKINKTNLICYSCGKLEDRFLEILKLIKNNPSITNKKLSKVLKRTKRYSQTMFLKKLGYIKSENYPKQLFITPKGLDEIQGARTR
ncbi:MAG: hypothetical protein KKD48_03365 [Nanoarchaeota archaeon]|nr:hypothetical protein [Nanoarchaeota archaeon]